MKIVNSSASRWQQEPSFIGALKHIEKVGRVCYKSEDKITEDSYKSFVEGLRARKHYAMLEHGTIYLAIPYSDKYNSRMFREYAERNPWVQARPVGNYLHVTTNLRFIIEHGFEDLIEYYWPTTYDASKWPQRITYHFVLSRGIANEFVRHRVFSFAQESTRYCNYSLNKFGNELSFVLPKWASGLDQGPNRNDVYDILMNSWREAEKAYFGLLGKSIDGRVIHPQDAREVLPLALKTELIMTGFYSDWQDDFLKLRYHQVTGPAHPDAVVLATEVFNTITV